MKSLWSRNIQGLLYKQSFWGFAVKVWYCYQTFTISYLEQFVAIIKICQGCDFGLHIRRVLDEFVYYDILFVKQDYRVKTIYKEETSNQSQTVHFTVLPQKIAPLKTLNTFLLALQMTSFSNIWVYSPHRNFPYTTFFISVKFTFL